MKQPNWKIPLILSTTLAVLGTAVYWHEFRHKLDKEKSETATKQPLHFEKDVQVVSFKLFTPQATTEIKCADISKKKCTSEDLTGDWQIISGSTAMGAPTTTFTPPLAGDASNIRSLLSSAAGITATETIDLTEETPEKRDTLLKEYGLDELLRKVVKRAEIHLDGGKKVIAYFGNPHPIGDKTFVLQETEAGLNLKTVFLVSNYFDANFDHLLTHWRKKEIFNFDRHDLVSFRLNSASGIFTGSVKDGAWTVGANPAVGYEGDSEKIATLFSSVANAKAKDFPAEKDATVGAKRIITFTGQLKDNKQVSLEVFEKEKTVAKAKVKTFYAKASDSIFEVDSGLTFALDKKLTDLRNSRLMGPTEKLTATEASISGSVLGPIVKFTNNKGTWTADGGLAIDGAKLKTLLDLLSENQIKEFKDNIPPGKEKGITLVFGTKENPERTKLVFWRGKESLFAQNLNSKIKESYWVNEAVSKALPQKTDEWKPGAAKTAESKPVEPKNDQPSGHDDVHDLDDGGDHDGHNH